MSANGSAPQALRRDALFGLLLSSVVPPALMAQREFVGVSCSYLDAANPGVVSVDSSPPNHLEWEVLSGPNHGLRGTYVLPFDVPGKPFDLGSRRILLPGRNSSSGKTFIEVINLDTSSFTINVEQSVDYGTSFDPAHVWWDAGASLLYVHDFAGKRVLAAPFAGTTLPPPSSSFLVVATQADIPVLSEGYVIELAAAGAGSSSGLWVKYTENPSTLWEIQLVAPGTWTVTARPLSSIRTPTPKVNLVDPDRVSVLGPISAWGIQGNVYLEEKTFGVGILGQATLPNDSTVVSIPVPQGGLLPGLFYEVHGPTSGTAIGASFMALVRHGTAQQTNLISMSPGQVASSGCWYGNSEFVVRGLFGASANVSLPLELEVHLWVAARHADGTDPIRDWAGTKLLSEVLGSFGPETVSVTTTTFPSVKVIDFPIPDEAGLGGAVPLFQWVAVAPTGEVAVSDVFGPMITQPWPGSLDSGSSEHESASSGSLVEKALGGMPRPEASRKLFVELIKSRPSWSLAGRKLELWNRLSSSK